MNSSQRFCHNCGKQLTLGAKFCTECGTSLSSLDNKPTPNKKLPGQFTPFAVGKDEDEDSSYLDRLEHLDIKQDGLQVEIVTDRPVGETVGSVFSQGLNAGAPPVVDNSPRNLTPVNKDAFMQEFKREAGAIRTHEKQHSVPTPT